MGRLFSVILSLSISGGLVGLLILLLRPLTERFFAKRWTYYLWLLVIARLILPVHADVNLMEYLSVRMAAVESGPTAAVKSGESGEDVSTAGMTEMAAGVAETEEMPGQDTERTDGIETVQKKTAGGKVESAYSGLDIENDTESSRREVWLGVVGILWIFGALIAAFRKIIIYLRFAGGVRAASAPVIDERVFRKSAEIQMKLGLGKRVPIYESTVIDSPMLIGILEPRIYMPSALLADMTGRENDICLILHHELVHYRRKDIWYKWLFQAALCVHWFNPLLYVCNRKFNIDCELACDEKVMALLSEEGRRAYGNVLLDVAQKNLHETNIWGKNLMHKNVPTMTLLEEKHTLKERLRGIAHYHKNGIVVGLCSAVVLAMFLAVAVVCGAAGVHDGSGNAFVMRNGGGFIGLVEHFWEKTLWTEMWGDSFDLDQPIVVNSNGKAYRMYDDDALIAEDSENDCWRAWTYVGGDGSVKAQKFMLNGSDTLWILYANKETALELSSVFDLYDGRFKIVCVKPDQSVQTLNEGGEENTVKITLPKGRNVIKIVGQKAKLKNLNVAYGGMRKGDFDDIYTEEQQEYAYQVLKGKSPFDVTRLEEVFPYLKEKEVSELCRIIWEDDVSLSKKDWQNMFIYSDVKTTDQYLLEELESGGLKDFDSGILVQIAPYMRAQDVSECFRYLLERDTVSESDWGDIFVYADADKSAEYLAKALRKGKVSSFSDKALEEICYRVSVEELTDVVTAMDELSFEGLKHVLAFVQQMDEAATCICYYIDLGNVLTDEELREIQPYVSEEGFYRVVEYNGKQK